MYFIIILRTKIIISSLHFNPKRIQFTQANEKKENARAKGNNFGLMVLTTKATERAITFTKGGD